jgi:MYXO-CTERM domain-containing protein
MFLHNSIQRYFLIGAAIVLALCVRSSPAQNSVVVNFDEQGVGTVLIPGTTPITLTTFGNVVDPFDPGSGLHPLAYNFVGVTGVSPTDGDVLVQEPTTSPPPQGLSDLLRFEHGILYVYSELPEPGEGTQLADVGLPSLFQANKISEFETGPEPGLNGLFGYAPTAAQPGSLSSPITYNFVSDPASTPEPGLLAAIPFAALALLRRRRQIV